MIAALTVQIRLHAVRQTGIKSKVPHRISISMQSMVRSGWYGSGLCCINIMEPESLFAQPVAILLNSGRSLGALE